MLVNRLFIKCDYCKEEQPYNEVFESWYKIVLNFNSTHIPINKSFHVCNDDLDLLKTLLTEAFKDSEKVNIVVCSLNE